MAVFNTTVSHESKIRNRPHTLKHDPADAPIPAYHPDTPEVRHDWAQYYDRLTEMDAEIGKVLADLKADGLEEETIVFYYGDHGSGMPRSKRWPYNSGLHVPLIVHVPEKFKHLAPEEYMPGGVSDRLVAFVDLFPTLLSLASIEIPEHLHGTAFLGPAAGDEQPYVFGFRGRMDERYDCVRSVRDQRFIYIRNFMPQEIYGQHVAYMFQTPTTQVWKRLHDEGKLNEAQSKFWQPKPAEELYDLQSDPDEVVNLAGDPQYAARKEKLSTALLQWMTQTRDVGLLPESEMHRQAGERTIYHFAQDRDAYDLEEVLDTAILATQPATAPDRLRGRAKSEDAGVRYWAVSGIAAVATNEDKEDAVGEAILVAALEDPSPAVRIVAAEAMAKIGRPGTVARAASVLAELSDLREHNVYTAIAALNALEAIGPAANSVVGEVKQLPHKLDSTPGRLSSYVGRLMDQLPDSPLAAAPQYQEHEGVIVGEAEGFVEQTKDDLRSWYVTTSSSQPRVTPDGDPPHCEEASGGSYIEVLPDTRRTHDDRLVPGQNFSNEPGEIAVLSYRIHVETPGRYYVWARAYSTGTEDNGLHVGLDGQWPESGARMQWCEGKRGWRWESRQRTPENHCGEPHKIYLDIEQAGEHMLQFSMREDGFEFDKFLLTREQLAGPPEGLGPETVLR